MADLHVARNSGPEVSPFIVTAKPSLDHIFPRILALRSPWAYRFPKACGSIPSYSLHSLPPNRSRNMERRGNILQGRKGI